ATRDPVSERSGARHALWRRVREPRRKGLSPVCDSRRFKSRALPQGAGLHARTWVGARRKLRSRAGQSQVGLRLRTPYLYNGGCGGARTSPATGRSAGLTRMGTAPCAVRSAPRRAKARRNSSINEARLMTKEFKRLTDFLVGI